MSKSPSSLRCTAAHCRPLPPTALHRRPPSTLQGCCSFRDLAVTDEHGEYHSDAEHLSRILSIATLLPADVPSKTPIPATFSAGDFSQPRVMILLETLFTAMSSVATGLRVHLLCFDPMVSVSSFVMHLMSHNDEMKRKNEARNRPEPINHDTRFARQRLVCESDLAESLSRVFDKETTACGPLVEYARRHPYASSETFKVALHSKTVHPCDHPLHPLSPELVLRLGSESLLSRTMKTTVARQLTPKSYLRRMADKSLTYAPPFFESSYLFCGRDSALNTPFPPDLVKTIAASHEIHTPGLSFSAYHFAGPPKAKRARPADAVSTTTSGTTDSV